MGDLSFVRLDVTGKCRLICSHCYAESGLQGSDGTMLPADWCRVIDEVARLGGRMVQFIGGEPTLYRGLPALVHRALDRGLEVEVFSDLVHVLGELWDTGTTAGAHCPGCECEPRFCPDCVREACQWSTES